MRSLTFLAAGTALAMSLPTPASAQSADRDGPMPSTASTGGATDAPTQAPGEIIVTARQRQESLKDIPIAVTAITGDTIKQQQLYQVRDVAALSPGLNINSDSVSRAFISIRGIGVTLIDTVQPGVGIFIDGIYQPNTSYLNSPLVDVARVEVLRGPQGTLFGNNTLGGAINVITNQPGNTWKGRVDGSAAPQDDFNSISGSVSGPIIKDKLQIRIGAAYHHQDGFMKNDATGDPQNPLTQKSVNGTVRALPTDWATLTFNASYDDVFGGNVPYFNVDGPRDYSLHGRSNADNYAQIKYYAANGKGEFDVAPLNTKITLIGAYNRRTYTATSDGDFGPYNLILSTGGNRLNTYTGELRFDTKFSDHVSTLIGFFGQNSALDQTTISTLFLPLGPPIGILPVTAPATADSLNRSRAAFGTVFVKLDGGWDIAVGGRVDYQTELTASQTANNVALAAIPNYKKTQFQPRVTLTKHFTPDAMAYVSVAKGVRGGGQNGPGAPNPIYRGDDVWTYELGTKLSVLDRKISLNADVFYNDYKHFIGQNALAPIPGGYTAINLNTGTVRSYGAEFEVHARPTPNWRIDGGLTLLHARITDQSEYVALIGERLPSNRILFVPDWNFNIGSNYTVPLPHDDALVFDASLIGKGSRVGSSLDPATSPKLASYYLVNGSITLRIAKGYEVSVFATNLFNEKYIESYLDKSLLVKATGALAPLVASDLAIQGDRRRVGIRASVKF